MGFIEEANQLKEKDADELDIAEQREHMKKAIGKDFGERLQKYVSMQ